MQAIPKTLAAEMIANRQLGAAQIIFKVMKVYQPGGFGERQNTLQALTTSVTIREQRFQTLR
jgi:alkylhydroperoxidase family enzyme